MMVSRLLFTGVVIVLSSSLLEAGVNYNTWQINYKSWSQDCVKGIIISINGQYPGPTIRARVGDTIVVEIENQMPTENVVIHWHGIRQTGTPWHDGTASMSQCSIYSGDSYTYKFVVDRPGTYFYHGHDGLQRSAGLYGSLIVDPAGEEPFKYDGELSIVLNDWWHNSTYEQAVGVFSNPFVWVEEPQSLLIEGRGQYNCSTVADGKSCNATDLQCAHHILPVESGKTYRLRIASVASLSALNFLVLGHKMTVVEADAHYVEPFEVDNLDVYSGKSYSVLITANQDPSINYWAAVNVRGRPPKTPTRLAIFNYLPNPSNKPPTVPPPQSPVWNDYAYSKGLAKKFKSLKGYEESPPLRSAWRLVLLNTRNKINGFIKWAINNISLAPPLTPYLAAMKYKINGSYDTTSPPHTYVPSNYVISMPPPNPNDTEVNGVHVDVILRKANILIAYSSEVHPWHLHGHDFWILGYGEGVFDSNRDPSKYNLVDPLLRNTFALFPYGWAALRLMFR